MCLESKLLRRKSVNASISVGNSEMQAPVDNQQWALAPATPSFKSSPGTSPEGPVGNGGLKNLSLSKASELSLSSKKLKLSPLGRASEESRRNISPRKSSDDSFRYNSRPRSPVKLGLPGFEDEVSISKISISSHKYRSKVDSSTLAAYTGAENVMAPSDLRTYLLTQVSHSIGCVESDDVVEQFIGGTANNLGSPEYSHTQIMNQEFAIDIPVEIFTQNPQQWTPNPSEGSIPMQAQESSITGSYNRVIIPVKSPSLEHYDDFFSSEEDVKTTLENDSISSKLVINWNMRSDTTLEILEPSRTSHSITFPKTNLEKHQTDIKDRPQGFVSDRPESDQIKPRRHNRKLTLESVIILENSKINAPVPESKSNGDRGEDNKNQPVEEMLSEDSSDLPNLRKEGSQIDNSLKNVY